MTPRKTPVGQKAMYVGMSGLNSPIGQLDTSLGAYDGATPLFQ